MIYFGFALSDSMFNSDVTVVRKTLSLIEVTKALLESEVSFCLNPSHEATVKAARVMGLQIQVPEKPPQVSLVLGDSLIIMQVRGLPRLTDRHEYTEQEVAKATFTFSVWTVVA